MLGEREEGHVWVSGPSAMKGYLGDEAATAAVLQDGWVRTGDLGYHVDGRLHVTGRAKDLVVRGGRNYHPQELEAAAEAVPGVRKGGSVAFGVPDPDRGTERVVVAFETRQPVQAHGELARAVAQAVLAATGLAPDEALAIPPNTLPKTTSGKRQRRAAADLYLQGQLGKPTTALDTLRQAVAVRRGVGSAV
jgi:acyl-CoA synthetase (AMP-forming)/AMP-acid ligase II